MTAAQFMAGQAQRSIIDSCENVSNKGPNESAA